MPQKQIEISRDNPTCVIFLLDQSGSMAKPFGRQPEKTKMDGVAGALNTCLRNLVIKCSKDDGIYGYLRIGVIGYGATVGSALGGELAGEPLQTINAIANHPLRVEQRARDGDPNGRKIRVPVWVEPTAAGKTPMAEAFELARQSVEAFIRDVPGCSPPVVINITDGIPTSDPQPVAKAIRGLASDNGPALVFNLHISDQPNAPIEFPATEAALPDKFAIMLFRMSSVLPAAFVEAAARERFAVTPQSRGFVFNGDLIAVDRFISFGTLDARPSSPE